MAIYHLSTKPISRSSGRSAVASIAYRSAIKIHDERLGKTYDYTKRKGVIHTQLITPNDISIGRDDLWNMSEKIEKRSNSRTAREIVINIPHEIMGHNREQGIFLTENFAKLLSSRYGVAVDFAIHEPDRMGDNRNYHAHLLLTTRKLEMNDNGIVQLTDKSQLELSDTQLINANLPRAKEELKIIRKDWEILANQFLENNNISERIDCRSNADRNLEELPTVKMGWLATELERKGIRTELGDKNRAIRAYNATLKQMKELELKQSKFDEKVKRTAEIFINSMSNKSLDELMRDIKAKKTAESLLANMNQKSLDELMSEVKTFNESQNTNSVTANYDFNVESIDFYTDVYSDSNSETGQIDYQQSADDTNDDDYDDFDCVSDDYLREYYPDYYYEKMQNIEKSQSELEEEKLKKDFENMRRYEEMQLEKFLLENNFVGTKANYREKERLERERQEHERLERERIERERLERERMEIENRKRKNNDDFDFSL